MSRLNTLVVLGNGFDLQLGLKSSYHDFFKSCSSELENNIWPKIININSEKINFEWKDIEYAISNFLLDKNENIINLFNVLNTNLHSHSFPLESYKDRQFIHKKIGGNREDFRRRDKREFEKADLSLFYLNILNEVRDLEDKFGDYLKSIMEGFHYSSKANKLLKSIITVGNRKEFQDFQQIQIINFNYTKILERDSMYSSGCSFDQRNIHGNLSLTNGNHDIIFGIDSKDFSINDKPDLYKFTKTYRVMNNNIRTSLKNPMKINKNTHYIYFYGHSLGEQDYSYFQSIFDSIDLYYNSTILRFIYSDNFTEDKENEKEIINERVARLLENYGSSFQQESARGKNLLHKLIVENRLEIIKFNPNEHNEFN